MSVPLTALTADTIIYTNSSKQLYRVLTSKTTGYDRGIVEVMNRRNCGQEADIKLTGLLPSEFSSTITRVSKVGDVYFLMKHYRIATAADVKLILHAYQCELADLKKKQAKIESAIEILRATKC